MNQEESLKVEKKPKTACSLSRHGVRALVLTCDQFIQSHFAIQKLLDHLLWHGPVLEQMVADLVVVAVAGEIVVLLVLDKEDICMTSS